MVNELEKFIKDASDFGYKVTKSDGFIYLEKGIDQFSLFWKEGNKVWWLVNDIKNTRKEIPVNQLKFSVLMMDGYFN